MLVPSGVHAKYPIPRNAESLRNPRFSRAFTSKITHSIPRRPFFLRNALCRSIRRSVARNIDCGECRRGSDSHHDVLLPARKESFVDQSRSGHGRGSGSVLLAISSNARPRGAGCPQKGGGDPMNRTYSFQKAPRCSATSKHTRERCKAPAVRGWTVCRFHGARGGGPRGKRNGMFKHGLYTKEAVQERRLLRELLRQSRRIVLGT
jgi:hypothetical protein